MASTLFKAVKKKLNSNDESEEYLNDAFEGYTFAAKLEDIEVNRPYKATVNGTSIGIYKTMFNGKKKIYAMANKCSHQGYPLTSGEIEEIDGKVCVGCRAHGMKFDLSTGRSLDKPNTYIQAIYKCKVVNKMVYVAV